MLSEADLIELRELFNAVEEANVKDCFEDRIGGPINSDCDCSCHYYNISKRSEKFKLKLLAFMEEYRKCYLKLS